MYSANFDVTAGQEIEPTWLYRHDLGIEAATHRRLGIWDRASGVLRELMFAENEQQQGRNDD